MKYSIIVPVYNTGKYLKKCLSSLVNQDFNDYEIIIVNDGSTDNSSDICRAFATKYTNINYIDIINEGVVIARQVGVEAAKGEYVLFVDSDDWVSEIMLKEIDQVMTKFNPELLCFESFDVDCKQKKKIKRKDYYGFYDYLTRDNIEILVFPQLIQKSDASYFPQSLWSKVFKREQFYKCQLKNVRVNMGEDFACVPPYVYNCNSMCVLHLPLYYYRKNNNSLTSKKTVFNSKAPEICVRHAEKLMDVHTQDFQEQFYRRICHEIFNVCVSQFNQNKPYKVVKSELSEILRNPYYNKAILKSSFSEKKARIMKFALQNKVYVLLWLYCKIK